MSPLVENWGTADVFDCGPTNMYVRIHHFAACLLLALYGVVGVTGESLHYLVQATVRTDSAQVDHQTTYYHHHSPDYHGHFHHHEHGRVHHHRGESVVGHHGESAVKPQRKVAQRNKPIRDGLKQDVDSHSPHACPLLTISSTLKLGNAWALALIIETTSNRGIHRVWPQTILEQIAYSHPARGPPARLHMA